MRPGITIPRLDRYAGTLPEGWHWQVKIDDERGLIVHGADGPDLFNRHWHPLAAHKAKVFKDAATVLFTLYPGTALFDVGYLGFRGHWTLGSLVLFDLPKLPRPWGDRWEVVRAKTEPWNPLNGKLLPLVCHLAELPEAGDPRRLFAATADRQGVEGIVGRNPAALYQCGDSREMVKIRWK